MCFLSIKKSPKAQSLEINMSLNKLTGIITFSLADLLIREMKPSENEIYRDDFKKSGDEEGKNSFY